MVAHHGGSIDSRIPMRSPLRGFVHVAALPRAPFPPRTWYRAPGIRELKVMQREGSIDSLARSPYRGFVYVAHPLAGAIPAGALHGGALLSAIGPRVFV